MPDRDRILALYDVPDPAHPGHVIPGYDKAHADRTSRIVVRVARHMGLSDDLVQKLETTALLHDIGRAGMDPLLFGRIFRAVGAKGIPVRVHEFIAKYQHVSKAQAIDEFVKLASPILAQADIPLDAKTLDHISMRLASDRRVHRVLTEQAPALRKLGVTVEPWMEKVILYYYYPEVMEGEPEDVRLMGMLLVACENFEARNNWERARDYYTDGRPSLRGAFALIRQFVASGMVSKRIEQVIRDLTASGAMDDLIKECQGLLTGAPLHADDLGFVEELRQELG
jgi:hypothetical protein